MSCPWPFNNTLQTTVLRVYSEEQNNYHYIGFELNQFAANHDDNFTIEFRVVIMGLLQFLGVIWQWESNDFWESNDPWESRGRFTPGVFPGPGNLVPGIAVPRYNEVFMREVSSMWQQFTISPLPVKHLLKKKKNAFLPDERFAPIPPKKKRKKDRRSSPSRK